MEHKPKRLTPQEEKYKPQHLTLKDTFTMYFDKTRRPRPSDTAALANTVNRMIAVGLLSKSEIDYINENEETVLKDIRD